MYSRSALSSEYIRPAGSGGSSMLCCSLPCGRREWRVLRHNWTSLIDSQTQGAPTLIGQLWSTISSSTHHPRFNPIWLVTRSKLSHAYHSFQSQPCTHGNGEIFVCNIALIKFVLLQQSHQRKTFLSRYCLAQMAKNLESNLIFCWYKPVYYCTNLRLTSNIFYAKIPQLHNAQIFSGLTINNYEDMVITWKLNGNSLTKGF